MLEETSLPYEPHLVRFDQKDQLSPEFRSLNPYAKIPAIIDPLGPNGEPLALFESAAILIYLADKSGKFLAQDGAARYETLQWLMFQAANISPIFGQVGFFHKFEGKSYEDKRPRDRYVAESRRLLDVTGRATRDAHVDHGRRLHGCGHRNVSDDSQLHQLLRGGRIGRHTGIAERAASVSGVRRATRGCAGGEYSVADHKQLSSPRLLFSNTREHQEHCPQTACASFVCSRLTSPATQRGPHSRARCAKPLATGDPRR